MNQTDQRSLKPLSTADRFQLFVSGVSDYAIYMLSPEGIVSSWNTGAMRFKGYTEEEIVGQHFSRFYSAEDQAAGVPARALETARREGKFEAEGWRVRKDGTRFWASVVIDPIYDKNGRGELIGFAKVTRDITERKQADEALRLSEERFRLLVQGVTDYAIYMLSPVGEVTNWNPGAQRIKGYTEQEIVGQHFSRFYTERDRALDLPRITLETALRDGRYEKEGWRVRKNGEEFWAHVVVDPIFNAMGELIGFAKITRDETERRESQLALERTKEALFHSQKLEAIGKLTGGLAHDFNNLLGVIVNGAELLAREVQSAAGTKILDSMQRAASRASTLTQQMLSFARQQPLRQEKHSLNRVIGGFEAVLRRAVNESIEFSLALAAGLPLVSIDAAQFEAALLNLVANARDAMPEGGRVTLRTEELALQQGQVGSLAPGRYVRLSVIDTGSGMPADVISRAVDPFFTTKPAGKGTGLGLSQVYGLVQQSGGDLQIASTLGAGTTISIYLPALSPAEGDTPAERGPDSQTDVALLVDDQPEVLEMAVELFRSMGYEVLSANNGADALEILERNPEIEVLFTDVMMPGMDGVELAQEARKRKPELKVILASGYAPPGGAGGKPGMLEFDFLTKPYRMSDLVKKLRRAG